jgi:hypothetical protein
VGTNLLIHRMSSSALHVLLVLVQPGHDVLHADKVSCWRLATSTAPIVVATTAIVVKAGLVVWPALHPSHYVSHARAAHRIALIPLLACQLLLWASTPPAPPSDRAEGPGHNIPLRVATAQQPWPMRHPVLAVLQAGRLTLQQDDPQDYALHAGLVMATGFAAHAWQLVAGSYDHASSGGGAHNLHVDWPQEALMYLGAYCGM